ncbi:CUN078 hypothetical protein [Culex nigripalpus nucleopolyhedrovirus]|uniref:Uncharacterized protein n=1 Tax=Culex nigripalpus nucleopolyhedrovirus (isolate Florida/1997) TaxID=645993 RepID=Q919J8_NPVCO|nr:CUN078 hypothetical protein [Culex nigripalpus nucleopolyhedrovirus]AAK94156.1 CUN078 hypothetical protein [Culex nigripalpus nucleopolyhedrovirus]
MNHRDVIALLVYGRIYGRVVAIDATKMDFYGNRLVVHFIEGRIYVDVETLVPPGYSLDTLVDSEHRMCGTTLVLREGLAQLVAVAHLDELYDVGEWWRKCFG